jgi:hypothetical protein
MTRDRLYQEVCELDDSIVVRGVDLLRRELESIAEHARPLTSAERAEIMGTLAGGQTSHGDAALVLAAGASNPRERELAKALATRISLRSVGDIRETVRDLLRLAAHTEFEAFTFLPDALGATRAQAYLDALEALAREPGLSERERNVVRELRGAASERPPASDGAAALPLLQRVEVRAAQSSTPANASSTPANASKLVGPEHVEVSAEHPSEHAEVSAELMQVVPPSWWTLLQGITGLLALRAGLRLFARYVLGHRRRGTLRVRAGTLELEESTEMFGRIIRKTELTLLGSARIGREERFPAAAPYAGAAALIVGTGLGIFTVTDGVRAGSLWLIVSGLLVALLGVVLDYVIMSSTRLGTSSHSRVHLWLDYRHGAVRFLNVDPKATQGLLRALGRSLPSARDADANR